MKKFYLFVPLLVLATACGAKTADNNQSTGVAQNNSQQNQGGSGQVTPTPSVTPTPNSSDAGSSSGWLTSTLKAGVSLTFSRPGDLTVNSGAGISGTDPAISIRNHAAAADTFSFPYVNSLPSSHFYMQMLTYHDDLNIDAKAWLDQQKAAKTDPETVTFVGSTVPASVELIAAEKIVSVNGGRATQRSISYRSGSSSVTVIYTYYNYRNRVYQFINHSTGSANLKTYNQILATFKFK